MGKSSKQETTQKNEPPAWAKPALERAGKDALALYDAGAGYNTYTGPTMAPLSDVTLGGMNNLLAATGYTGAPVTNQSIMANVPDVNAIMRQATANKSLWQAAPTQQPKNNERSEWTIIKDDDGYYREVPTASLHATREKQRGPR